MTERCICEFPEDVQTCFCFCVFILYVLSERLSSVVGHSKCGEVVGVWDQLTVQRDGMLSCVFAVPWEDECECGFCCGDLESVCLEPRFQSMYICILVNVWQRSRSWGVVKRL